MVHMSKKSLAVAFLEEPVYMGNKVMLILLFMLVNAVAGYGLAAADWPQFRGPNGTGRFIGDGVACSNGSSQKPRVEDAAASRTLVAES